MIDLSRWLPGLAPDPHPEENDPVSRTLRMLGLGGSPAEPEPQPAPVSTYNDPTAYPQQPLPAPAVPPYVPPPSPYGSPADDPGGAGFAAQDAFSTPPLQDDRWRDEGPRELPRQNLPQVIPQAPDWLPTPREAVDAVLDNPVVATARRGYEATRGGDPGAGLRTALDFSQQANQTAEQHRERTWQIEQAAAAELGIDTRSDYTAGLRAAMDAGWRQRHPELAAEYDQIVQEEGLNVAGQAGDSARMLGRAGTALARQAQGAQGLARGGVAADLTSAAGYGARAVGDDLARGAAAAADEGVQMLGSGVVPRGRGIVDNAPTLHGQPSQVTEPWRLPVDEWQAEIARVAPDGRMPDPNVDNAAYRRWYELNANRPAEATPTLQTGPFESDARLRPAIESSYLRPDDFRFVREITVEPRSALVADAQYRQRAGIGSGTTPRAKFERDGRMTFQGEILTDARAGRTLTHEVGHSIENNLPESLLQRWEREIHPDTRDPFEYGRFLERGGEPPPTQYASENAREDFAESFAEWRQAQAEGRQPNLSPLRQQFMRDVDAWLSGGSRGGAGGEQLQLLSGVGASARPGLYPTLYNAAQGGVAGAVSEDLEAYNEGREADPAERWRRGLGGAGLALAGGRAARGGGGPSLGAGVNPQPTPRVQRAAQSANPHVRDLARQMQGRYQPSGVEPRPLMERIAAMLTDRHAIVGNVEREIGERITAAGGTAPVTRLAERVRANPNSIAAQRARDELAPALQKIGDDADWAEQYLVHRHNLDVAKAKGQEAYDEVIARGGDPAAAQAAMDRVRQSRLFSGGMTEQEIIQAVSDIQTEIGPSRFQNVVDTAQAHWDVGRKQRDELLAEGFISPAQHQEMTTRYPHYVRTDIADYFEAGPAAPTPGGRTMGVSNVGIKAIDRVGTTKDRVNPVLSTIDGMYAHEGAKVRNAAAKDLVQLRDADPDARALFKEVAPDAQTYAANTAEMVPPDYSLRGKEQKLTAWENGEARQFVIPAEYGQLVSPSPGGLFTDNPAANGLRAFFGAWKAGITTHNPAFQMVVSPVRDLGDYAVGEATRSATHGGPVGAAQAIGSLPGVVADYVKALPAAFEGLGTGQVGKELGALRRAGAGMDARPQRTDAGLREVYADLARSGGMAIRSPSDVVRAARTVLTLGAEPIGSRLEQVPRIAAARRAAGRGADELGQAMAARDATIDFQRGGWMAQQLNAVVPFLNPTMQSAAQVARLAKQNPAAFSAAVATGVGLPAMVADAWNRSDPQRAQDYQDVPDSVKNGGIVWMLPAELGVEGETALGERKPNYLFVPLGSFAFAARMAREGLRLADPLTGLEPTPDQPGRDTSTVGGAAMRAAELGGSLLAMFSPVKGENLGSTVASLIPPVASEAIEVLGVNKDLYRGNAIATDRRDETASNLSKGIASGLNTLFNTDQARASQVEHVIQGVAGYPGQLARGASDLGRDRGESRPVQDLPVVGGLVSRIVRDAGGQRLQDVSETDARVPESIRPILAEAGMRSDEVTDVPSRYRGAPLTRLEQEQWQEVTNRLATREIAAARRAPEWRERGADRKQLIRDAMTRAREDAAARALRRVDAGEIERRIRREDARKAAS